MTADVVDALEAANADEWLIDAMKRLVRGESTSLESVLDTVGEPIALAGTRATARCHFVARDGNNRPQITKLAKFLEARVTDYCIPRRRFREAVKEFSTTGSAAAITSLAVEARELFTTLEKSGEGGELLLFALLETGLGIPQILSKMPLKTSTKMHVHGADGVHATVTESGTLALYWGESKLHQTVNSAIDEAFRSLSPFLSKANPEAADRDLLLVRDNLNSDDARLTAALLNYLDPENPLSNQIEFRGACLVGFDLADYPTEQNETKLLEAVRGRISTWHDRIVKTIGDHSLHAIEVEVFCIPFPSVQEFRDALTARLSGS